MLEALGRRVAESHPYAWKIAWEALHRFPFLLPHDKSYNALKHFIAAAPNGLFLDIGANDGVSALSFRRFDKAYRIVSIEPNFLLEPALRRIRVGDPHFDYRMVGAGAAPARAQFFVPSYNGVLLHTFTSGSRQQVMDALKSRFGGRVASRATIRSVENEIIRLDDLNLDPTIVKIDAEGFDYDVLVGLETTITRMRPFIMVEIAWDGGAKIPQFFEARDYVVFGYDPVRDAFTSGPERARSAVSGHRNFFAVPREKQASLK